MRKTINRYDSTTPIVDSNGRISNTFRILLMQIEERGLLIGTGSPEGVVSAQQGQEYMDDAGTAGAIKYIKRDADISGDRTKGWIAI